MEKSDTYQKPFGLKTFFIDGKEQVCVYEDKLVPSVYAQFEVRQCILEYGESAEMVDTYIALKKADGQYQLFCYADGKLNKGPMCENYINDPGGFIYKDFRGKWYRSLHNCSGATVLGKYDSGIWLERGKTTVWVSYLTEHGWEKRKYQAVEKWYDSFDFYAFKKKNGKYDLLVHLFSGVAKWYADLSEEDIEVQKAEMNLKILPEEQEEFVTMCHSRIHGR